MTYSRRKDCQNQTGTIAFVQGNDRQNRKNQWENGKKNPNRGEGTQAEKQGLRITRKKKTRGKSKSGALVKALGG